MIVNELLHNLLGLYIVNDKCMYLYFPSINASICQIKYIKKISDIQLFFKHFPLVFTYLESHKA